MNYDQIWQKMEDLPWCALVTSGRNGSDYFQSLLDSHPEVLKRMYAKNKIYRDSHPELMRQKGQKRRIKEANQRYGSWALVWLALQELKKEVGDHGKRIKDSQ